MSTKQTAAQAQPERGLTKEEACEILQVGPSAEAEIVTQAYWHLAGKQRAAAGRDRHARRRLDELNQAFLVLSQPSEGAPPAEAPAPTAEEPPLAEELVLWLRGVIEQIAARWPDRAAEVAVLATTTVVLTSLALWAGASAFWTVLAAAVAGLTIWAPWRRR